MDTTFVSSSLIAYDKYISDVEKQIADLQKELDDTSNRDTIKALKTILIRTSSSLNTYTNDFQTKLGNDIINSLFDLEKLKIDGKLDEIYYKDILYLYDILSSRCLRNHARYVKMPKDWILLGFMSGFLEDLVVVMRTLTQTNISKEQMVTLPVLITNYRKYITSDNSSRFPFITKLFEQEEELVREYIINSIKSQGKSKRISMYCGEDKIEYYYAIQGLLGNMKYDSRVVKSLHSSNCPIFAVHFTKSDIANKIWNKEKTTSVKGERELPVGTICKFQRSIHALTNIEYNLNRKMFHIISSDKDIRNRMTHGIKQTNIRPKYESGLVIDLRKLVEILPYGTVQMNEIGTLLVHDDIPNSCIINLISTDDEIEYFWNP